MLATSKVMAFVATSQPEQAKAFYRDVLGLALVADDPFGLVFDANGTSLRVQKVDGLTPQPFTALGWHVSDIAATAKELQARGVRFERYVGMGQDELGVWNAPGGARVAWFKDPDGNTLSLTQF